MAGRTPSPGGHGAADHSSAPAASARQGGGPGVRTAGFDGVAPRWSVGGAVRAQLRRDLTLALRRRSEAAHPLIFFFMVCTLFPLGIGPEAERLAPLAPGILWVVALLACLMASDSLFRSDFDDGSLEQMLLSPVSLYWQVLARIAGYWLVTGLPLTILSPLLALMLQLPVSAVPALLLSLLLGTVVLSL